MALYLGGSITVRYIPAAAAAKSLQLCPTLSDPMDCSLPDSSVHGIFQTRVLEWGAIAFSEMQNYVHISPSCIYTDIHTYILKIKLIKILKMNFGNL